MMQRFDADNVSVQYQTQRCYMRPFRMILYAELYKVKVKITVCDGLANQFSSNR